MTNLPDIIKILEDTQKAVEENAKQLKEMLFYLGSKRCLELAIIYWESHRKLVLVEGRIINNTGERINHYWLESKNKFIDPQAKRVWDKEYWYQSNAKPNAIKKYNWEEGKIAFPSVGKLFLLE